VIGQATGLLMAKLRLTAEQAFDLLVQQSQTTNVKLRDVAQAQVDQHTPRPPRPHQPPG
jgi:AmiR/NasT family two-component response regulator